MIRAIVGPLAAAALIALTPIHIVRDATAQNRGSAEPAEPPDRLRTWQYAAHGVFLELTQRLPDQTRGFFEARGFEPKVADEIASYCFFQSIVKNTAPPSEGDVEFDLGEWRAIHRGGRHRMRVREYWDRLWSEREVSEAARIAFKWSLFPTRQTYASGEYNWGMTVFALRPSAVLDLEFSSTRRGRRSVHRLTGIECAPDVRMHPR
ncbi:MAG: hypothetical protein OEQ18_02800 [Gammaproteobacteria bacterium]|nr:hypothetical protein [Gammaproteobacteria bacterium]